MNLKELVAAVAAETGLTKVQAEEAVKACFHQVTEGLKADGEVKVAGFGNFRVKTRAERHGRNPRTGEEITIPAAKTVSFSVAKNVKESV